jgi:FKBP-type peptidyl-prolyl cis-trans isomerase FkpA
MSMRLVIAAMMLAAAALGPGGCDPPPLAVEETPIKYDDETIGRGTAAKAGDLVCIDYDVLLPDGQSVMREDDFCFYLGAGAVIAGLDEGLPGMRPGGRRTVQCPPHKHWGRQGQGGIPPNTTLTLRIKLISIE